jgi:hypothetical protein
LPKGNSEVRGFQGENFVIFDSGIKGFEAKIHSKLGGLRAGWRSKKLEGQGSNEPITSIPYIFKNGLPQGLLSQPHHSPRTPVSHRRKQEGPRWMALSQKRMLPKITVPGAAAERKTEKNREETKKK